MKHKHPYQRRAKCVELVSVSGIGVCIRETVHGGSPDITNPDGSMAGGPTQHLAGFLIAHDVEGEEFRCEGSVMIDPHIRERGWTMTGSLAGGDLTLHPSIECRTHPTVFHAYVQEGKWTG